MLKGMLSMAHDEQATQIVNITEAKQQIIDELRAEIDKLQRKPLDVHDTIAGNKSWPFNTPEPATADTMVDTDEDHSATDNALFFDISDEVKWRRRLRGLRAPAVRASPASRATAPTAATSPTQRLRAPAGVRLGGERTHQPGGHAAGVTQL